MVTVNVGNLAQTVRDHYHFAWSIVAMGTALRIAGNFVSQAFAVILVVLQEQFAGLLTLIIMAQVFRSVASALLSPAAGWVGDRYGVRRSLLVAATLYVVGMLLLATIGKEAPWPWLLKNPLTGWYFDNPIIQLYLYYSLVLGLAQALFTVNIPTTVAAWFKRKLGVAVGIQQSVGGMGASITAPGLAFLLSKLEWDAAFLIVALVGGVIIFALLAKFHGEPADRGMQPYGATEDDPPPASTSDPEVNKLRSQVFLRRARRTRAFWNLPAIHHVGCVGHAIVIWHIVFFATEVHQISLAMAAWIVTIYTLTSVLTRFATPILADRFGAKPIMAVAYFLQGITVLMLFWAEETWEFYVFAALFGVGFGGEMSAFLVINRQYYGMGPVRTLFGFQHLGSGLGMAVGGLIGGLVYDIYNSYDIAWIISVGASWAGVVLILLLEPTSRLLMPDWEDELPERARSTPPAPTAAT